VLFHFIVPFFVLLPQFTKRAIPVMATMSIWIIGMHWVDLHWVVVPVLRESGGFHWLDFTCWLGLTGIFVGGLMYRLGRHPLVPQRHPALGKSLRFENM
jgi:hypothetical protein